MIPLIRFYIRYFPIKIFKLWFWNIIVEPYIRWGSYNFVVRTVFGSHIKGNTIDMIQQYIYYFGIWEPNLTHYISSKLKNGDVFVDVGSNIGYYSLLASKLVGNSGIVIAVEAAPSTFNNLLENISINRYNNIRPVNVAASNSNGSICLYEGSKTNIGETSIIQGNCDSKGYEVTAMPLIEILLKDEFSRTRLIKIDVEGAELSVVEGMIPLLYKGRKDLEVVLEVNPERLKILGKNHEQLLMLFYDAGFNAYKLENDYSPYSYLKSSIYKPIRLRENIQNQVDIIFSRKDADYL